jgi:hypothetical protein
MDSMNARRDGEKYIVELTPQEAHVLIWGGPNDLCANLDDKFRTALVEVEDRDFTDVEYRNRFGDLSAMYADLHETLG